MKDINDIKIVGIDEDRPPLVRKESYIDLYFKLSHKAPMAWCEAFNTLGHQINPPAKIDTKDGLIIETWIRDMDIIQAHLDKLQAKVRQCNQQYSDKLQQEALALAARNAATQGMGGQQNSLNLIIAGLDYDS